jgi:hypothetical protein
MEDTTDSKLSLRQEAETMLKNGVTAPEFSAHFFSPGGKLSALCSNLEERKKMTSSPLYRWLQEQMSALRNQEAEAFDRALRLKALDELAQLSQEEGLYDILDP